MKPEKWTFQLGLVEVLQQVLQLRIASELPM